MLLWATVHGSEKGFGNPSVCSQEPNPSRLSVLIWIAGVFKRHQLPNVVGDQSAVSPQVLALVTNGFARGNIDPIGLLKLRCGAAALVSAFQFDPKGFEGPRWHTGEIPRNHLALRLNLDTPAESPVKPSEFGRPGLAKRVVADQQRSGRCPLRPLMSLRMYNG